MGDELDATIALTQNSLGSLITKPKLTDKYLKKPPFRFLHDIVMETIRSTGFAQGLYTAEEGDAGSMSDKQAKVDFLTKIISCTSFALGQEMGVAPGKIVAGLEPEKTNLWLQKLHEAATSATNQSEQAVQRVLSGETVTAGAKEKKKKKEEPPPQPPPPQAPPPGSEPASAPAPPGGPSADELAAQEEEKRRRSAEKEKRRAEETAKKQAAEEEAEKQAAEARRQEEKARKKEEERRAREEEKQRRRQEEAAAQAAAAEAAAQQDAEDANGMMQAEQQQQHQEHEEQRGRGADPEEIAARAEALMAAQQQPNSAGGSTNLERPRTAGRKPPKVTSKVTTKTDVGAAQAVEAPTVIGEGDTGKDDDDEMFVERPALETNIAVKADEGEHHGKLVREILEEKKKEEEREREESRGVAQAEKVDDAADGGGIKMGKLKRKKDQAQQYAHIDVLKLRDSIQQLCQAANPLGKSIDLVHQDIANMGKELDHWRQESRNAVESYHQERKVTEEVLMPLHRRLAELDESIAEAKSKVQNSRSRILKNDVQIQSLLESVVASK